MATRGGGGYTGPYYGERGESTNTNDAWLGGGGMSDPVYNGGSGRGLPQQGGLSDSEGGHMMLGMGMWMQSIGKASADWNQAFAERDNARWYREQADFAERAGQRQLDVFDNQSKVLIGNQGSAFAKAGVDTGASSFFIAKTVLERQQEHGAIKAESDMNVRLATLRAAQADKTASDLDIAGKNELWSGAINMFGQGAF